MKRGFTLLEMLIVIGIISALIAATLGGYQHVLKAGERARAHELVANVATALTACFERERVWPKAIRNAKKADGGGKLLDETIAWYLRKDFSVDVATDDDTADESERRAIGLDRFGIVTPWATTRIKRLSASLLQGKSAQDIIVSDGATVQNHIIRFEVDLDGDGLIENVPIGGVGQGTETTLISVRATAVAWCCGKDGKIESYEKGLKNGGIYSWSYGQTVNAK